MTEQCKVRSIHFGNTLIEVIAHNSQKEYCNYCVSVKSDKKDLHIVEDFYTYDEADACALGIIEGLIIAENLK